MPANDFSIVIESDHAAALLALLANDGATKFTVEEDHDTTLLFGYLGGKVNDEKNIRKLCKEFSYKNQTRIAVTVGKGEPVSYNSYDLERVANLLRSLAKDGLLKLEAANLGEGGNMTYQINNVDLKKGKNQSITLSSDDYLC